ncbi:MAG: squalene/phytoene synthase family protein [Verrucomicrobiota bacterium]|nr:squalene/phytoene synthase family protein [Verrucomicrobiota bacterium]
MSSDAREITRASKSNLALAFVSMSGKRRRDITTFYAFCRLVDDVADDNQRAPDEKRRELAHWRRSLHESFASEPAIAPAVRQLMSDYPITPAMLEEIITGVEMDIEPRLYATFEELRVYCYRVASAVGLVSIEIFGYRNAQCREFAVQLGLALQTTNIIRDVGRDLALGRVYLPQADMAKFDYSQRDLENRTHDARFLALMKCEAARAEEFYAAAKAALPRADRRAMLPATIMASIYGALLQRMKLDNFRVFEREYRLSKLEKAGRVTAQLLKFH